MSRTLVEFKIRKNDTEFFSKSDYTRTYFLFCLFIYLFIIIFHIE